MTSFKTIRDDLKHKSIAEVCNEYDISLKDLFMLSEIESGGKGGKSNHGRYIAHQNGKWIVRKHINGVYRTFGSFDTLKEAEEARNTLVRNNWVQDYGSRNIGFRRGKYHIRKMINGEYYYYGSYNTLDDAVMVRDMLIEFKWDKDYLNMICSHLGVKRNGY